MNEIDESDITHRSILEEAGFRKRGCTMFRVIGHQEIRYLCVDRDMYVFEGRYGVQEDKKEEEVQNERK